MISDQSSIKLEINRRKIIRTQNVQILNRTLVNNPWAKEEITQKIRKYLELSENQNTTYKHLHEIGR